LLHLVKPTRQQTVRRDRLLGGRLPEVAPALVCKRFGDEACADWADVELEQEPAAEGCRRSEERIKLLLTEEGRRSKFNRSKKWQMALEASLGDGWPLLERDCSGTGMICADGNCPMKMKMRCSTREFPIRLQNRAQRVGPSE
jgi:hypothetical protein